MRESLTTTTTKVLGETKQQTNILSYGNGPGRFINKANVHGRVSSGARARAADTKSRSAERPPHQSFRLVGFITPMAQRGMSFRRRRYTSGEKTERRIPRLFLFLFDDVTKFSRRIY